MLLLILILLKPTPKADKQFVQIDSLKIEGKHIKDTIEISEKKIITYERIYEKNCSIIMYQPIDSDCVFFSNYLSTNFE